MAPGYSSQHAAQRPNFTADGRYIPQPAQAALEIVPLRGSMSFGDHVRPAKPANVDVIHQALVKADIATRLKEHVFQSLGRREVHRFQVWLRTLDYALFPEIRQLAIVSFLNPGIEGAYLTTPSWAAFPIQRGKIFADKSMLTPIQHDIIDALIAVHHL